MPRHYRRYGWFARSDSTPEAPSCSGQLRGVPLYSASLIEGSAPCSSNARTVIAALVSSPLASKHAATISLRPTLAAILGFVGTMPTCINTSTASRCPRTRRRPADVNRGRAPLDAWMHRRRETVGPFRYRCDTRPDATAFIRDPSQHLHRHRPVAPAVLQTVGPALCCPRSVHRALDTPNATTRGEASCWRVYLVDDISLIINA